MVAVPTSNTPQPQAQASTRDGAIPKLNTELIINPKPQAGRPIPCFGRHMT